MMTILIKRADEAANDVREYVRLMLDCPACETVEGLARTIRAYDKAVATILDCVCGMPRDHDCAFTFLEEHPRFNKTGAHLAREALLGRGKLD